LDKEYNMNPQAFDITVQVTDPIRDTYVAAGQASGNMQKEIAVLDEKICALVQSIHVSKLKRDFMTGFSTDPVTFINKWIASQSRDLEV
jgi:SWI/SNF-related matrix-associated actin-dependent regulator of chromatin subfamily D